MRQILWLVQAKAVPHRSKSEAEQLFAEAASWQEPVPASEKVPEQASSLDIAGTAGAAMEGGPGGERLHLLVPVQHSTGKQSGPASPSKLCQGGSPALRSHAPHTVRITRQHMIQHGWSLGASCQTESFA